MTLSSQVSVGDLVLFVGLLVSVIANWAIQNQIVKQLRVDVENLRRGRGLIMGQNADHDWPPHVLRCFGMTPDRPHVHRGG